MTLLKQALEALETGYGLAEAYGFNADREKINAAIAALRAQPDHSEQYLGMVDHSELIAKLRVIANKGFTDYFNSGHPNSNVITKAANALEGL